MRTIKKMVKIGLSLVFAQATSKVGAEDSKVTVSNAVSVNGSNLVVGSGVNIRDPKERLTGEKSGALPNYSGCEFEVLTANPQTGGSVQLRYSLGNSTGVAPSPSVTGIYLSEDEEITTSDILLLSYPEIEFFSEVGAPCGGLSYTRDVQLPASLPSNQSGWSIGVIFDVDGTVNESNEGDNSNQGFGIDKAAITIGQSLDLPDVLGWDGRPDNPSFYTRVDSSDHVWGESVTITFVIANFGSQDVTPFRSSLYLSEDPVIDPQTDRLLTSVNFNTGFILEPNQAKTVEVVTNLPEYPFSQAGVTEIYIGLLHNDTAVLDEGDTNNNSNLGIGIDITQAISVFSPGQDSDGDGISDVFETNTGVFVGATNTGTDPNNPDSDGDGLSDGEEINEYFSNPVAFDSDNDGFNDGAEVLAGTSVTEATETPTLTADIRTAIEVAFFSKLGSTYQIEFSSNGKVWEPFPSTIDGTGARISRFYSTRERDFSLYRIVETSN